jgi:hypothetical protein
MVPEKARDSSAGFDPSALLAGSEVRIVLEQTGELLRELTLDAEHRYFGIARSVHSDLRQVSSIS